MSSSLAHSTANCMFRMTRTTRPMNREASSVQTSSPLRSNSSGPGCMPYCWKAASMMAAVAEVGRPRASRAPIAVPAVALPAASGAATPLMEPVEPNSVSPRRLASRFSVP